ncbi:probable serine/threonine-protein kinase SIS8 isoform X2 [Daucus carota subsp. sativus]|uniref:probable serine/threonine-protein kinase SIS8 isoform X2 n=1 Tax=Daucus carota subsp. sativus TaxID=79200 RepID=UPI0007F03268|nr:PREDICTED: serine/threonine-protein kinase EDR1-like isoform X2 [Daucus carota subsp. sativus]
MKNLLKKLHIRHNQSEELEGSTSSKSNKFSNVSSPERLLHSEHKPFSAISGWLNSVKNRRSPSPPRTSNAARGERIGQSDSASSSALEAELDAVLRDSGTSNLRDPDIDEDYQMELALELSAREDPEAVEIEAVKQISLVPSRLDNTGAEVVAYRYWNYSALSYDDTITDGFYDLYGISMESTSSKMPSLFDLQSKSSDDITWEAVLVDTVTDSDLKLLKQKASDIAARSGFPNFAGSVLVKQLAALVSDQMGGPVGDPDNMSMAWRRLSFNLRESLGSLVLPLGSVTVGLPRHRALLFKFLADSVGIPCRLVKGQQYTGSDDVAMNFVRVDDDREYIVDLMADPGTLIPSDIAGSHIEYEKSFFPTGLLAVNPTLIDSSSSGVNTLHREVSEKLTLNDGPRSSNISAAERKYKERNEHVSSVDMLSCSKAEEGDSESSATSPVKVKKDFAEFPSKPNSSHLLVKSPSWTEGVSSPAAQKMKVKDVSQYMIDAAEGNPELAQKLHAVLLESGVVAPPNLFTKINQEESNLATVEQKFPFECSDRSREGENIQETKSQEPQGDTNQSCILPFLPYHEAHSKGQQYRYSEEQPDSGEVQELFVSSQSDVAPSKLERNVPVASASSSAAAAVVASSILVAASRKSSDSKLELPVAAAATAKAAVLVATTAALSNQYENQDLHLQGSLAPFFDPLGREHRVGDAEAHADATDYEPQGCGYQVPNDVCGNLDAEKISDKSTMQESIGNAALLDEVSDCEILWEDITLGERIGLGSYGEVYRGDWHGTEVAVKKFIDQVITDESLKEFKSEVRIMKRARHPNVVLFMGAVTRAPNLSIVTEFLPRGSLYRLIHKPNNQLDVRRRMRMALDAARGMNYLHNCTPVIVHRDLKSPNLLVDKNWVVKVCDFGLSRMKYSTFLSSRSTAGTVRQSGWLPRCLGMSHQMRSLMFLVTE